MKHPSIVKRHAAFSLIEMLMVLGVITILVTLTAPHIAGILTASRLRNAAEEVHNRLLEAQSLAMLFNTDSEIRIYETQDIIDDGGRPTLRKLRIHTLRSPEDEPEAAVNAETFEPAGSIISLDQEIEISADTKHSSIVDLGFQEPASDIYGRYIALRFHPDGSAGLQPGKPWFLTLHEKDAHLRSAGLKNFVTLQIDPATGHIRSFHP